LDRLLRQAKRRIGALTASAVFAACSVVPDSLTHNFEGNRFAIQRFLDPVTLGFEQDRRSPPLVAQSRTQSRCSSGLWREIRDSGAEHHPEKDPEDYNQPRAVGFRPEPVRSVLHDCRPVRRRKRTVAPPAALSVMKWAISSARFHISIVSASHLRNPRGSPSGAHIFTSAIAICHESASRKVSTSFLHESKPVKGPVDKTATAAIPHFAPAPMLNNSGERP
jgi:hypothetical protein